MEQGEYLPTEAGTPQGGIISSLLLNIAMHGMEEAAGERRYSLTRKYQADGIVPGTPAVVRYADDFVVMCHTREEALAVKARLTEWFRPRGLAFNEDKTRIVHLSDGFDFLGFTIRCYPTSGKVLTTPSKAARQRIRDKLRVEVTRRNGANAAAIIAAVNPVIRGWAAYYRIGASKKIYSELDYWMWIRLWRWARRTHPNKGKRWVQARYWGRFHPRRDDRWVFGDHESGRYLRRFAWTPIVRHVKVKGRASVDDPALTDYWRQRRSRRPDPTETLPAFLPASTAAHGLA
jgi:RNA-directed DNA polymerase